MRVGEEVAVERPAEGEQIQGLAALLLCRGADGAAGLQDPPLRAALREKHAAHQPPQGLEASQVHQNLGGGQRSCELQHRAPVSYTYPHTVRNVGCERRFYSVLSQEGSCFSLISDGQPDVWEGGEVVTETTTHFHLDGLA